jgi:hypothetical protein
MPDPIEYVYPNEVIDNGGLRVQAPKGLGSAAVTGTLATNYEIDTYSVAVPTTGEIVTKYDARFTGCPPCTN